MRWMITDSGMGGLSVCAGLEKGLTEEGLGQGLEIIYVNATPEEHLGYNSLKTQVERIAMFDRFISASYQRFNPDEIAIACNTLSVIYDETLFSKWSPVEVKGIVDAGVKMSNYNLAQHTDQDLIVFATETTTEADTYPQSIISNTGKVVGQACPDLASAISKDASGVASKKFIEIYVKEALSHVGEDRKKISALLACTHYGYQAELFRETLEQYGITPTILDPNQLMVEQLLDELSEPTSGSELKIRFVSRFPIPSHEVEAMGSYLGHAPLTLNALHHQEVIPDLFGLE